MVCLFEPVFLHSEGQVSRQFIFQSLAESHKVPLLDKDWEGSKYVGISIDCDYLKREVHMLMPGYVEKSLWRFKKIWTKKTEDQPYVHATPDHDAKVKYASAADTSWLATKKEKTLVQKVVGTSFYYGRVRW